MMSLMPDPMPRRLKVNSRRNSACSVPLSELYWRVWHTDADTFAPGLYLLVANVDGDRMHRVYCKHGRARLSMIGGELHWLIDAPLMPESE